MFHISVNKFPAYKKSTKVVTKSLRTHIDIIYEKVSWLIIAMYIKPGMTMHHTIQYVLFIDLNAQLLNLFSGTLYYFCRYITFVEQS